jgi:hypothetical protein
MKRLCAVLGLALSVSSFCLAQAQTGNASYNPSKTGAFISHPSLSFNTRVKVTNLSNNLSAEAVVNGRVTDRTRIADISRDVGDALGMSQTGLTMVRIELLHAAAAPVSAPEPAPVTPAPAPPPRQTGTSSTPAQAARPVQPAQPAPAQPAPAAPARPAAVPAPQTPEAVEEPVQPVVETVTEVRYVPLCYPGLICLAILVLLFVVIALLVVILVLTQRFRHWPWYYPIWLRRHFRHARPRR